MIRLRQSFGATGRRFDMIHTASFFEDWNWGKKGRLVSIALTTPMLAPDREIVTNELLCPEWNLVNSYRARLKTTGEYRKIYMKMLYSRIGGYMLDMENGRLGGKNALKLFELEDEDTLLCWENHGRFCHRIIVAELLRKNGVEVARK